MKLSYPSRRAFCAAAFAASLLPSLAWAAEDDVGKAKATVERLHAALLEAMKNAAAWKYAGRAENLAPVLTSAFNLPAMARVAIGPSWRDLTEDQRSRFVDVFIRFTVATYANRFDGWSGERFETLPEASPHQGALMVQTRLHRTDGQPPVALNYLLRAEAEAPWRIVDVYLSGTISELATRRSEYAATLKRDGVDKLIAGIEAKVKGLSS